MTTARWWMPSPIPTIARAAWLRSGRDVTDARARGDARRRRPRHPLQLRPAARRLHAARGAVRDRAPDCALVWHVVVLFRGAGPARALGLLHDAPTTVVVDHMGRSRRRQAGRRTGVRAVRQAPVGASEHLVEGELSRAPFEIRVLHVR
jgi:hypothetical protein